MIGELVIGGDYVKQRARLIATAMKRLPKGARFELRHRIMGPFFYRPLASGLAWVAGPQLDEVSPWEDFTAENVERGIETTEGYSVVARGTA